MSGKLTAAALAMSGLVACAGDREDTDRRIRQLSDDDGDGLMTERRPEDGSRLMWPDPGDCPLLEWREIHTVVYDADGNVVSESYEVCMQCMDEDGNPVGEETCYEEPPLPPDVYCEEYGGMDGTVCYYCISPDGTIVEDSCYTPPAECTTDADCPEGQVCYIYDYTDPSGVPGGGMGEDRDGDGMPDDGGTGTGYCGLPDPCVMVDSLPEDPTGESCWECTDPATGEDWGRWCDFHRCADDGSCVNEWEVCDPAGSGYCIYDDPCDPVDSLPEDPTGESCWLCTDPMAGAEGSWGWCDIHRCAADGSCANPYEICDPAGSGYCVYDDPCDWVESLPEFPGGSDCYRCTDPETGTDLGSWCNTYSCDEDGDCYEVGLMCGCDEATGTCLID